MIFHKIFPSHFVIVLYLYFLFFRASFQSQKCLLRFRSPIKVNINRDLFFISPITFQSSRAFLSTIFFPWIHGPVEKGYMDIPLRYQRYLCDTHRRAYSSRISRKIENEAGGTFVIFRMRGRFRHKFNTT